ncbi:hypothetical protein AS850_01440 [Frondihabitans sp. 762G35]|uniref:hypothetical protein n=1 Tax=Frondihabitans sp. 762G35 TaxID=1446794 RepID=UPI000D226CA7|nr:hypothetical protein [Frondihabitans sp. 762G35]ARC55739.1 hypothetical protein AS850_01440 [Frondihabitans sp. 762G35]
MDRNRLLMIGAAVAALAVIAGGFLLGVQPQLQAADSASAQETSVRAQNASLVESTKTLESAYSKLDSLTTQLTSLKASIPQTGGLADLIREYNTLADKTDTTIVKIVNGDAEAYTPPAVAATATGSSSATATASPSPSATAAPTSTLPVAPAVVTSPLITAANFSAIPVSVEIKGSYAQALEFLKGLHDGPRLFLVTQVTSSVSSTETSSAASGAAAASQSPNDWTISGLVYALTDAASAKAQQQSTSTSTAAGTATDASSADTAAGK